MLPWVVLHNEVSVDGRVEWLDVHMGLYYELARSFEEDATLAGADTILAAPDEMEEETQEDLAAFAKEPDEGPPLLVIPDSRGRVRVWHMLRRWPHWGRFIALVSDTTPVEYLEYLGDRNIDVIRSGEDHVDLRRALEQLRERYDVRVVRTDSGGTLNGLLLKEGLVDEVSILLNASLVGGKKATTFIKAPPGWIKEDVVKMRLTHAEEMDDETVWLKYDVVK
jgi:2,5-diamino-6-(ribosylamino)-4(3H)-pyrimidinone 5'-phosphate reductase